MKLGSRLAAAAGALAAAGLEEPRREARLLLCHAARLDAAGLLRHMEADVPAPGFEAMVARRARREPLAYITGLQPFWTFSVAVSPATLIPRADSETLVEAAVALCRGWPHPAVLDLGTGTGCLLLAALLEFPDAWGVGTDRQPAAAALARHNAAALGMAGRAAMLCADWAAPLAGPFDLVLANPPYIPEADIPGLMPEVAAYEPATALAGGADGLDAYRAILAALPGLLARGGVAIFEVGQGKAEAVAGLAAAAGLRPGTPRADLSGIPRALPVWAGGKKSFGDRRNRR